jgi:hypothetical protein
MFRPFVGHHEVSISTFTLTFSCCFASYIGQCLHFGGRSCVLFIILNASFRQIKLKILNFEYTVKINFNFRGLTPFMIHMQTLKFNLKYA